MTPERGREPMVRAPVTPIRGVEESLNIGNGESFEQRIQRPVTLIYEKVFEEFLQGNFFTIIG